MPLEYALQKHRIQKYKRPKFPKGEFILEAQRTVNILGESQSGT